MILGFGLFISSFAKLSAAQQDAAAKKSVTVTPIVEVRERLEERWNKSFSEKTNQNRNDLFTRWRAGFGFSDGQQLSGQFVYEYTNDIYRMQTVNGASDTSDLLLGFVTDKTNWGAVTLGRQRISIGNQRILGESDWKVASNSWDALRVKYGNADVFAGRLEVSSYESEYSRMAGGVFYSGLGQTISMYAHDRIGPTSTDIYTVDQNYKHDYKAFKLDAEAAGQLGSTGGLATRAWMADAYLRRNFGSKLSGYVEGAVFSGGKTKTSDMEFQIPYGTKHSFGGYADVQGSDNVKYLSAEANYQFKPTVGMELVYYKFSLFDNRDAWMSKQFVANKTGSVSFIDPTGGKGGDVGQEIDLAAKWAYSKTTEFSAGAADFLPGNFVKAFITPSNLKDQIWFFAQISYKYAG